MQIKDVEKLKAWLLTKLEPLCDADPAALAKYVVALLRKDKPKSALKELCIDQLEVFLAKETTVFVDRLFRGLDSESYLTGHDPKTPPPSEAPSEAPPTATPPISHSITKAPPSIKPPTAAGVPPPKASGTIPPNRQPQTSSKSHASGTRDGTQTFSMSGSGSGNEKGRMGGSGTRRHSEDPRSREVDDDDRDFRRSRARGGRGGGDRDGRVRGVRGGVTVSREPDSSTGGGRRGVESAGMKGRGSTVSTSVDLRGRRRRGEGEGVVGGVSSTGSRPIDGGSVRRIVRERSGAWQDERSGHSDNRPGRRSWQHRSRSRSNSHSSSSDSSSSTSSSHGHGRKRSRQEWNERSGPSSWGAQGAKRDSGPGNKKTISGEDIMVDGEEKKDGREVKRRCKDYDEKGFCMLGDQCPFDHGIDPVVIGNNIPHTYPPPPSMVGIPSLTLTKPGFLVPAGKVSPTESTTDGYNPEEPGLTATSTSPTSAPSFLPPGPLLNPTALLPRPFPHPPPHHPSHHPPHIQGVATIHHLHPVGTFPPPPLPPPISSSSHHFSHHQPHSHWSRPPLQSFPPLPRQPSDTLIVRKIPRESNTITKLSNHFEKFGTIVNLTVWYGGDPEGALVQYSTPFEARKAHDSAEAVLNNRFIKIYYLRKDMPSYFMPPSTLETPVGVAMTTICDKQPLNTQQQGSTTSSLDYHTPSLAHKSSNNSPASHHSYTLSQTTPTQSSPRSKGPPPLRSTTHSYVSANTTSSISSSTHQTTMNQHKRKIPETLESQEMTKKRFELQKKTRELLQKQINQQKLLILKLEKGGKQMPAEEKKKIMKTLKSLSVNIVKLKNMASEAMEARLKSKQTSTTQLPPPSSPTSPLPYYSASLTEKAQALRQEAHKLGLITSPSQPLSNQATPPPSHQATPTSKWAGGQVKDLRAMLNKKQKSLLVLNAENREQLTAHFDGFGGLVKVEVDPDNNKNLIFSFRHAHLAQKAAKHSSSFNGKPLIMKWYTAQPPSPSPYTHSPNLTTTSTTTLQTTHHPLPPSPSPLPMLPLSNPSNIDTSTNVPSDTTEQVTTPTLATPTLTKLDPEALHLVEDDEEDEESEERSWRR